MAESSLVCPSELHLKKELGAARKARCLRDPETCSSRRSDLASRSMAAYSGFNAAAGGDDDDIELDIASALPSTAGPGFGKVYLYNWVHHSSKSSDGGVNINGEQIKEEADEMLPDEPLPRPPPSKTARLQRPTTRKSIRKTRRAPLLKRQTVKVSARAKLFDPPSSAYETLNSSEGESAQGESIRAKRYASSPDSPLISGSGCRNWSISSRVLRSAAKDESSYSVTPASASSIDRCLRKRIPASGISSSSKKRGKEGGRGGWCSPSLSDTLKRKGTSILCGSQARCQKTRSSRPRRQYNKSPPTNSGADDQYLIDVDATSDDASTHFEELDLEPVSGLDGNRWAERRIRRQANSDEETEILPGHHHHRSLSQKYRPRSFDEITGQNIVVQSLRSATLKGRIAPAYLFHGPRGTGKTSTARVFAAAVICLATAENKPCGFCRECVDFASGGNGSRNVIELDAGDTMGVHEIANVLKNMQRSASSSRRQVLIIDECHALPSKVWPTLIRFLEEPSLRAVFLLVATDPDALPRAILSRCQKYLFPKIKDADAARRLRMLSSKEGLEVDPEALGLIALNSDGSLRDAETMLEQLSLLGKKITTSLVNDLVGLVSEQKLLDLLETAMSSNTSETVRRCRELLDSGVDPMVLTSQLAGVIMDTIAGMQGGSGASSNQTLLRGRSLTASEVARLQEALKLLSDAEKQLRMSSERSTWFTAAMLQLGGGRSPAADRTSSSSSKQSLPEASLMNSSHANPGGSHPSRKRPGSERVRDLIPACSGPADDSRVSFEACEEGFFPKSRSRRDKLDEIWRMCIENCHSNTLRQLLFAHGQVLSISQAEGAAVVSLAFDDEGTTNRAEGYSSSIANSMETVLGQRVRIRMRCVSMGRMLQKRSKDDSDVLTGRDSRESFGYSAARRSADCGETRLSRRRALEICGEGSANAGWRSGSREDAMEELTRMRHNKSAVVVEEDRIRVAAGATTTAKAERNQKILPQTFPREPSKHWEDAVSQEMKALRIGGDSHPRDQFKEPVFSPSFLRQSALDKESRWGCSGLLCWKQASSRRAKRASNSGARSGRLLRLGACLKASGREKKSSATPQVQ